MKKALLIIMMALLLATPILAYFDSSSSITSHNNNDGTAYLEKVDRVKFYGDGTGKVSSEKVGFSYSIANLTRIQEITDEDGWEAKGRIVNGDLFSIDVTCEGRTYAKEVWGAGLISGITGLWIYENITHNASEPFTQFFYHTFYVTTPDDYWFQPYESGWRHDILLCRIFLECFPDQNCHSGLCIVSGCPCIGYLGDITTYIPDQVHIFTMPEESELICTAKENFENVTGLLSPDIDQLAFESQSISLSNYDTPICQDKLNEKSIYKTITDTVFSLVQLNMEIEVTLYWVLKITFYVVAISILFYSIFWIYYFLKALMGKL